MPNRKRKSVFGSARSKAKKMRLLREAESTELTVGRQRESQIRMSHFRAAETSTRREFRQKMNRQRTASSRNKESIKQRESRLEANNQRNIQSRQSFMQKKLKLQAFNYNSNTKYENFPEVTIGKMDNTCKFCQARKFLKEAPGMCCSKGKVRLTLLTQPPDPLHSLMLGITPDSRHFLKNIRKYNSSFQMTSFGTTSPIERSGFMPTFKIQGQIYHKSGSLLPGPNVNPKFLQIYFIGDEDVEADQRCQAIGDTKKNIILIIQRFLHHHNNLIKLFKTSLEKMPSDEYKVVIRADKMPVGEHERRFNAPVVNEAALVMVGNEFDIRDVVIQKRNETLRRISETHRSYDSLQYPLIFWKGDDGYHFNIMQVNPGTGIKTNKKVTCMQFYAHQIMLRNNLPNHILNCRQLFNQFIVDMYAKIESERLLYIRLNQKKLRVDEYIHLRDAIVNDGNVGDMGQVFILPATYTGSPRHMHEYTQDAMSYVRKYGCPDLFITFTCNPAWLEIKEELLSNQIPSDRHDLTARVFKQKLMKLIHVLTKCHIYGDPQCWMYTIEWQKRGLPHAHILIWFKEKIRPTQIDSIIAAELPNPLEDPVLFENITKHMIHGPCGLYNPYSPCMKEGRCSKKYPRQFIKETQYGNDGYPLYRRRKPEDGGYTTSINIKGNRNNGNEIKVDNSWIVPYSPILSKMFEAHINVEYCNSVKSIKYICKYVNKGSDMAMFGLKSKKTDEITQFQMGRYISSNEAIWRILNFSIHERFPTVVHLSVHLENGQRVYFTPENAKARALEPQNTTLTAFFVLCQQDPFARTLLYEEVPKYYTWNSSKKIFCKRRKGTLVTGSDVRATDTIGRVYTVHPNNSECYYLRILLHTVRGPTSFDHIKTVNGTLYHTFRETCQKLGLLENDQHWDTTLSEASLTCFPVQLRSLFAIILTACAPSNPQNLWDKYKNHLSEDILLETRAAIKSVSTIFSPEIYNACLIRLEDVCLSMSGKSLLKLGLQAPDRYALNALDSEFLRETNYNIDELEKFVEANKPKLVHDQKIAYDIIMQMIDNDDGGIFFIDAPGGTGKTFLINLLLADIRRKNGIALAVASSGIAATLLEGGRTAHSALHLPLNLHNCDTPVCNIKKRSAQSQILQTCKVIVWDECTMAHKKALEALDRTLQDLRGNARIMGGTVIVLAGDFRQTLPVIPRSTPADEINACLKSSYLWRHVKSKTLMTNMRVHLFLNKTLEKFSVQLLQLGNGNFKCTEDGLINFPPDFCTVLSSVEQIIENVFPNLENNYNSHSWLCERAILSPRNDKVNALNILIQNKIPSLSTTYTSIDTVMNIEHATLYPIEFLNSLEPTGMPPHKLTLKIGSSIVLLRNINPPKLCNGTRLVVKNLLPNIISATILTGCGKGENVFIPRIPLIPSDTPFDFKRLQFPVRLAFALTINKAQGQSLKVVGINLDTPCFSHGQLYVACSRVGNPQNLFIFAPGGKTKNIVYQQALI